jgi:hypothetical protein
VEVTAMINEAQQEIHILSYGPGQLTYQKKDRKDGETQG